jgi:hypothetical protein
MPYADNKEVKRINEIDLSVQLWRVQLPLTLFLLSENNKTSRMASSGILRSVAF